MNPYDILGVLPGAEDAAVRGAYLQAVKQFPPEHSPERFAAISDAYQKLKDETSRLAYELFSSESGAASPMEAALQHFSWNDRRTPPDFETLKRKLREYAGR